MPATANEQSAQKLSAPDILLELEVALATKCERWQQLVDPCYLLKLSYAYTSHTNNHIYVCVSRNESEFCLRQCILFLNLIN